MSSAAHTSSKCLHHTGATSMHSSKGPPESWMTELNNAWIIAVYPIQNHHQVHQNEGSLDWRQCLWHGSHPVYNKRRGRLYKLDNCNVIFVIYVHKYKQCSYNFLGDKLTAIGRQVHIKVSQSHLLVDLMGKSRMIALYLIKCIIREGLGWEHHLIQ